MGLLTLFLISLMGSPHCAAMCGGFVAFYTGGQGANQPPQIALHMAYNGGRLVTYLTLGGIASVVGSTLNQVGFLVGVSHIATTILGIIFLLWGLNQFFDRPWELLNKVSRTVHQGAFGWYANLNKRFKDSQVLLKTFVIGVSSTLLPCGLLYSFAAAAGASGSLMLALATMFIFWLGTLPILVSIATISKKILQLWNLENSKVVASLLIIAGLFAVSGHFGIPNSILSSITGAEPKLHCH